MNRSPWDEALVAASTYLANAQRKAATAQSHIAMGLSDGCLPLSEHDLEDMQNSLNLFFESARQALNHTEKKAMVINDPAIGPEPLYPGQPTYCEKYGCQGPGCPFCEKERA